MSHTPGPWELGIDRNGAAVSVLESQFHGAVCGVLPGNEGAGRLISAAPELLEACKAALPVVRAARENAPGYMLPFADALLDKVDAAIAKTER
jgi:hypothetical protein